jgi:hypothetical protein
MTWKENKVWIPGIHCNLKKQKTLLLDAAGRPHFEGAISLATLLTTFAQSCGGNTIKEALRWAPFPLIS